MVKAVIFDADGVLIHGEMFSVHLARDYGISTETTLAFFQGEFQDCIIGKKDLREILPKYLQKWGWKKSVDDFLCYWFESEHIIDQELIAYIQALRAKGIKCYVATNQEKYRFAYMLEHMGFKDYFDKAYCSAHLSYQKPDTGFFEKVFKDIGVADKEDVLFWDDSARKVAGAKTFGIQAEVYTNFEDFKQKMKKYGVDPEPSLE